MIVLFALIDDLFLGFLRKLLNPTIKNGIEELFKNGFLSTASSRITLSAELYWISETTYKDLRLIRDIRNRFAHDIGTRDFDNNPVRSFIATMSPSEEILYKVMLGEVGIRARDGPL